MGDANPYLVCGFFLLIAIVTASTGLLAAGATKLGLRPRSKLAAGFVEWIAFTFGSIVGAIIAFRICFALWNTGGYPGVAGMIFLSIAVVQSVVYIALVTWDSRRDRPLTWKWKLAILLLFLPLAFAVILFVK